MPFVFDKAGFQKAVNDRYVELEDAEALDKAIEYAKSYGGINQLMTDHGTQFIANKRDKNGEADHKFEKYVKSKGIQLYSRHEINE